MYVIDKNQLTDEGALPTPRKQLHATTGWEQMMKNTTAAPVTSPDKKYTAFIKNHNIYVKETATGKEKQLSLDGTLGNYYSAYIRWSPDSKKVASCKIRPEKNAMYIMWNPPQAISFNPNSTNKSMPNRAMNFRLRYPAYTMWKQDTV